ncbi:MAG: NUDIX hydrolase, partial [Nitrososphaerota archaeon]
VEHPGAVAIVALRNNPAQAGSPLVALVRQERPVISRNTWELPAGLMSAAEVGQPEQTARRELREETGYDASTMTSLTKVYSSPGFTNEVIVLYLATDLQPVAGQTGPQDPTEINGVTWLPLGEAISHCRSGEINDSKTVLGLLLARDTLAQSSQATNIANTPGGDAMPFSPSERNPVQPGATDQQDPLTNKDQTLRLESMMLAEFTYANSTAYQALEDRGRMFSFYLGIASVLAGGVGALYGFGSHSAHSGIITSALFLLAGFIGLIFFFKIVRIRQAFDDSLLTMNVIKDRYIKEFTASIPDVEKIFRWRTETMPSGRRFGSLTFLVCLAVTVIDSIALGLAAVVITELVTNDANTDTVHLPANPFPYMLGWGVLIVALLIQIIAYEAMLSKTGAKKAAKRAVK